MPVTPQLNRRLFVIAGQGPFPSSSNGPPSNTAFMDQGLQSPTPSTAFMDQASQSTAASTAFMDLVQVSQHPKTAGL